MSADRSQASGASQLAQLDNRILASENLLAAPGIDAALREKATDDLALLRAQRPKLAKRNRLSTGTTHSLASVDAQQVSDQQLILKKPRWKFQRGFFS